VKNTENAMLLLIDACEKMFPMENISQVEIPSGVFDMRTCFYRKAKNVLKLVAHCKENEIPIVNANYMYETFGDAPFLKDVEYYVCKNSNGVRNSVLPDFNKFETVYYAGASFDQCVYHSRPLSYSKLKHPNKKMIIDCCIQTSVDPRTIGRKEPFRDVVDRDAYIDEVIAKKKINYIYLKDICG
tara:strand:+ start:100 stop:654 length:555 start_codon:yes stop_codon:yes gene_type:complete